MHVSRSLAIFVFPTLCDGSIIAMKDTNTASSAYITVTVLHSTGISLSFG